MNEHFCCPENYSVLIPYRDLLRLVEMAENYELMQKQYQLMVDRYASLSAMFSECLEKIAELDHKLMD